jgi:hypothetical protein
MEERERAKAGQKAQRIAGPASAASWVYVARRCVRERKWEWSCFLKVWLVFVFVALSLSLSLSFSRTHTHTRPSRPPHTNIHAQKYTHDPTCVLMIDAKRCTLSISPPNIGRRKKKTGDSRLRVTVICTQQ